MCIRDRNRAELTTAILAGPPAAVPVKACANSMKYSPMPLFSKKLPKIKNIMTKVADTPKDVEKIPSSVRYMPSISLSNSVGIPLRTAGSKLVLHTYV